MPLRAKQFAVAALAGLLCTGSPAAAAIDLEDAQRVAMREATAVSAGVPWFMGPCHRTSRRRAVCPTVYYGVPVGIEPEPGDNFFAPVSVMQRHGRMRARSILRNVGY